MLALDAGTAHRSRAYRAFRLDRAGRVRAAEILSAEDDTQARRRARAMVGRDAIELWERTRFLGRFEPAGTAGQARPAR
ncbi:hypothetical protein ABID82_004985 [Methylobacterium sp. PvP062]|jgi:hypothetical protein|uniref:Uncharacterized protein n=2 Tax=Methylobacterium radiotolerans TaxID=31998 RepID=B1LWU5_METRJ|nr:MULTISPECIES: hypothetical protein [Methylobacterium]MBE7244142.1 hypothetical protein [Actinomycetospora chiangmaiensis]MCX7331335.1 hypothetical protein [Hyphomicrobiales bacterium]GAN51968.1 hypothetical protein ME121_6070 [Methylobacterium sp. ME121]ACB24232.1 hypothetical protein Mrad2831_2237 [Methylobacterium radiotolerans JCM 2831]KIU34221.1 hypothetical protein SR39_11420 [Methylobacterium radiotolerans]